LVVDRDLNQASVQYEAVLLQNREMRFMSYHLNLLNSFQFLNCEHTTK